MALHDFYCVDCGRVLKDRNVPIAMGAAAYVASEHCACGGAIAWIPQVGRMDALEPFQRFTAYDGKNNPVIIDSLHKLRQVERDSEQHARNGEGTHMTWRHYSQDKTNLDVNTHGPDPAETPSRAAVQKFASGKFGTVAPERDYGPGVSDANTSAFGSGD